MRGRAESRVFFLMVAAAVLLSGMSGRTASSRGERAKQERVLTAAANTFRKNFHVAEPVPLVIAIANAGPEPVYVSSFDRQTELPRIKVRDAEGKTVRGDPIPTPSKPPGDHYMEKEGKRVLMQPLWKLEGGGGVVIVIPDALKRYHKHVTTGTYTLHPAVGASRYRTDSIVRREGLRYEYWAEAAALISQRTLEANVIKITIE